MEGPICPQHDVLMTPLLQPRNVSEGCIYANVHVPLEITYAPPEGLPILVYIHEGGFAFGSGDTDIHGPEYLIRRGVIVITFNYR